MGARLAQSEAMEMELTFAQDRIIALMGNQEPKGSDECRIVMHVIDALLENKDSEEGDFRLMARELAQDADG